MFRLVIVALAVIGAFSLFGGVGIGAFFLLPLLFIGMMMFVGCGMRRGRRRWQSGDRGRPVRDSASREDRFDEWHRIAHAREEVDSWVDGMPGGGQE